MNSSLSDAEPDPPALAVVIPCFNMGGTVVEALESALASPYPNREILLIDDGSSDAATLAVIEELERRAQDRPGLFRVIRQENRGVCEARNRCIRETGAAYILPLDADNRLRPGYLQAAAAVLDAQPAVGVVHGGRQCFGSMDAVHEAAPFDPMAMLRKNRIDVCALFRRQVWVDVGGFDGERFAKGYEDWDFWLGAWAAGWEFRALPGVYFDYRVHASSRGRACDRPEVRRELMRALAGKHRALFERLWPDIWAERDVDLMEVEKALDRAYSRIHAAESERMRNGDRIRHLGTECARWQEWCEEQARTLRDLDPLVRFRNGVAGTRFSRVLRRFRYAFWR